MKKNLKYILALFIMIFCGVSRVEATGITCEYDIVGAGTSKYYLILSQEEDGLIYVWKNSSSKDITSDAWESVGSPKKAEDLKEYSSSNSEFRIANSSDDRITDNVLNSCPEKVYRNRDSLVYVFNDNFVVGEGHPNGDLLDPYYNSSFKSLNAGNSQDTTIDDVDIATKGYGETCGDLSDYWIKDPGNNKSCLYATQIQFDITTVEDFGNKTEEKTSCIIVQVIEENSKLVTYSNFEHWTNVTTIDATGITEACSSSNSMYAQYQRLDESVMPKNITLTTTKNDNEKYQGVLTVRNSTGASEDITGNSNCEQILGDDLLDEIQKYINIIRIAVPILLFVLGTIDFAKAVFSNEDEMKKAQKAFMKRVIIAVAFFLIPTLLNLLLTIANSVWGWNSGLCSLK